MGERDLWRIYTNGQEEVFVFALDAKRAIELYEDVLLAEADGISDGIEFGVEMVSLVASASDIVGVP
jgi:hypothetical protein